MCADRSSQPIVHLVGSIPLPDAETVFRTLSAAVGPHLVRVPDGETGIRKTWIRFLQDVLADNPASRSRKRRAAVPVRAVGRQADPRDPAPAPQAAAPRPILRASRPAMPTWRSSPGRVFQRLQKAGVIPGRVKFQVSLPTPIAPTYNNMLPADRPRHPAAADAALDRRGGEDRRRRAPRPPRPAVGRLPGGAGVGGLLREGPGRFPQGDDRRAVGDRRRGAGRHRARLSPLLRQPRRRAPGPAQGHRHHGGDDQRHRRRREAADPVLPHAGAQGRAPTMPTSLRSQA